MRQKLKQFNNIPKLLADKKVLIQQLEAVDYNILEAVNYNILEAVDYHILEAVDLY